MERLEDRSLLAGDVAVTLVKGVLNVQGDAAANDVAIVDLGGGTLEVSGRNGTTVNGSAALLSVSGVTAGLKVDLKAGADVLSFVGNADHRLAIVSLETGPGADTVSVDQVFAAIAKIETGPDDDRVQVMDMSVVLGKIETGLGDDQVTIGDPSIRADARIGAVEFEVETGAGNDTVRVQDAILETLIAEIETGAGNDSVSIADLQSQGTFKVETGSGDDAVTIAESKFRRLTVELGAGDLDQLAIESTQSSSTKLDGGLGNADALRLTDNDLGVLKIKGFESVS